MPTGGVSPEKKNLAEWFKSGVYCVGMGSKLFPKEVIEKGDFAWIENKVKEVLDFLKVF